MTDRISIKAVIDRRHRLQLTWAFILLGGIALVLLAPRLSDFPMDVWGVFIGLAFGGMTFLFSFIIVDAPLRARLVLSTCSGIVAFSMWPFLDGPWFYGLKVLILVSMVVWLVIADKYRWY